ncbi:MAG: NADH-quinone oxidoreductase chain 5 [Bacteroidetes bacterium HGW-Bacteroidetes-9]|nr:MAG: NADH-quinone oxidoreductase chain 5 [Bacteroidetes bacterium HGW-Bacteroidetes-9]
MTNEELITAIGKVQAEAETRQGAQYVETTVPAARMYDFMNQLKQDKTLAFDYLFCLTGMDQADHMQVVYHLESVLHKHVLVVRVKTADRENPVLDSVSDIWPTAEFHENEVYDLLGIRFNNHPDLRRLFLDENWGFPLRKDFKDDIHIVSR